MKSYRKVLSKHIKESEYDLLYARSPAVLSVLVSSGVPTVLELHTIPKRNTKSFVNNCNKCKKVVALTTMMRDHLIKLGVDKKKIIVEGDAVDLSRFKKLPSKHNAKHHWDLPEDKPIIGYVGSLVTMDKVRKGVDHLVEAFSIMKKRHIPFFGWIVGGPENWQKKYHKLALTKGLSSEDFLFQDPIPSSQVPDALKAIDICVYPAPRSKKVYFQRDTSPLKLFEYLASGQPIVCADIPPVRDIVDKSMVNFVHPGSAKSLFGGIKEIMDKPNDAAKRAKKGLAKVNKHSWSERMKRIIQAC